MEIFWLCGFSFLAGFVDSVVGGGGLIQLPALFVFLPKEVAANVAPVFGTNKLSSLCGTSMAAAQYARRVPMDWPVLLPSAVAAFVFSFLGARAVTLLDAGGSAALRPVILALLVAVATCTFLNKNLGGIHRPKLDARKARWFGILTGCAIGFYDGFFGPGTGSFLLFIFIGAFGFDFLAASASAKVINFATNLSAVSYFGFTGNILWAYAIPMAACNIIGAVVGARLAILKGNGFVRALFLGIVSLLIVRFGYEIFFQK